MKKITLLISNLFSKYESLDNVKKYDIQYLYHLLIKNDNDTYKKYIKHMPVVNRWLIGLSLVLFLVGLVLAIIKAEFGISLAIVSFAITLTITVYNIAENSYRETIKNQIEYRKYLEDK